MQLKPDQFVGDMIQHAGGLEYAIQVKKWMRGWVMGLPFLCLPDLLLFMIAGLVIAHEAQEVRRGGWGVSYINSIHDFSLILFPLMVGVLVCVGFCAWVLDPPSILGNRRRMGPVVLNTVSSLMLVGLAMLLQDVLRPSGHLDMFSSHLLDLLLVVFQIVVIVRVMTWLMLLKALTKRSEAMALSSKEEGLYVLMATLIFVQLLFVLRLDQEIFLIITLGVYFLMGLVMTGLYLRRWLLLFRAWLDYDDILSRAVVEDEAQGTV